MPAAATASPLEGQLRQLEPVLRGFAIRAVRDPELARDLVQDALLSAFSAQASFDGRSSLRTWVVSILSHKILDHLRRKGNSPESSDDPALTDAPSPEDVERVVMARQSLGRVELALTELPERERLAILMVDVESLPRDEVCRVLGVQATHLRVLLHRGRNRLRRMLENG